MTRRQAVIATLGLFGAGCASTAPRSSAYRARPDWPGAVAPPANARGTAVRPRPQAPAATRADQGLRAISRRNWASAGPVAGRVNPMRSINRITVHHEGWKTVYFTDAKSTADRIEKIRAVHVRDRHWGDIGYHYVVDRAGRLWEARHVAYQGAHVKDNNPNNIGILVLGNFDDQTPSQAQVNRLVYTLRSLQKTYRVRTDRVYTHQELMPTACPGTSLQRQMVTIRNGGYLV